MFKRKPVFSSQNQLSGQDRKGLRYALTQQFGQEEVIESILSSFERICLLKVKGQKMQVLRDGQGQSLFVDASGKGDYFPCLQLCGLYPSLVDRVELNQGVETFLLKGANLMWPGVHRVHRQDFLKDDVVAIVKRGGEEVVGVGAMATGHADARTGGVAVYLLHHQNDRLYELSPPVLSPTQKEEEEEEDSPEETLHLLMTQVMGHNSINSFINEKESKKGCKQVVINLDSSEEDTPRRRHRKTTRKESESFSNYSAYCEDEKAEQDDWIESCFIKAVVRLVHDRELPMDPSLLFSLMCQCKGEGDHLDLKASSYKKIGRFLRRMAKERLIDYKVAKKGADQPMVTRIYRDHKKYQDYQDSCQVAHLPARPLRKKKKKKEAIDPRLVNGVGIEGLFKVRKEYQGVIRAGPDGFIGREGARERMLAYCQQWGLLEKKRVVLDNLLFGLFSGAGQEQELDREELLRRVDRALVEQHRLTDREGNTQVRPGPFPGLTLVAEKAHNKKVTKVRGLELFSLDPSLMASYLQLRFASSVTTHETIGKHSTGRELVIQGHFVDQLQELFHAECLIDRAYISTQNKLEKKKN